MQMLDRLAAVLTDIGDNAIAVGQTRSLCNLGNGKENVAHGIGACLLYTPDAADD